MTDITWLETARDWRADWHGRWARAAPSTRTRVQVGVFLAAVLIAYHYSLSTLVQSLNIDTPLAYIGLVPVIALALAFIRSQPRTNEPGIHDRQLDYIVGVPLLAVALAVNLLLPRKLSTMFWIWRIDLLSLPFFVAGAVAVLFGVRAMWRQRLAIAFLFLAWPVPYSILLLRELGAFTAITLNGLRFCLHFVHVARPLPSTDGSVFNVSHHGRAFPLSVVSACAGVNGMVGFLLVGAAFGATVAGPRVRKAVWLVAGLGLLWLVNLGRLLLIFWTGHQFGEHFAIKILHPFVGLVTFNMGVVSMLLLLKPFGLRLGRGRQTPEPAAVTSPAVRTRSKPLAVPTVYFAIVLALVLALIVGVTNSALRAYDLVASATGEPKLASYLAYPAAPHGWKASFADQFDWAKPYFGESSTWYRYAYTATLDGGDLHANLPVIADVIDTKDLFSFSAYGVEACYRFHGYSLRSVSEVSLGGGITGQTLSYTARAHGDWSIVYWIWPVKNGATTRYERVILYMQNTGGEGVTGPPVTGLLKVHGSLNPHDEDQNRLLAVRGFLVAFAREVVQAQTAVPQGSALPRPVVQPHRTKQTVIKVNGHPKVVTVILPASP
jgi:exosortase